MSLAGEVRRSWLGWALVTPSALLLGVFTLYPVAHALYLSFFDWNLSGEPRWVGGENYAALAGDAVFAEVVWNTALYAVGTVVLTLVGGLLLALALNRRGVVYTALQGGIFTSYIVSWVGVSLLWTWILDSQYGLLNGALGWLGWGAVDWLGDPELALGSLVGVTVWKTIGYDTLLFLAGLQAIPAELYEAAEVDGAGRWSRFWHVTWPQLRGTTLFVLMTSLIMSFQSFDVVQVMTQGGPVHATSIYVHFVYEQAFRYFRVGYASAAVVIFFGVLLAVTVVQLRLLGGRGGGEA